MATGDVTQDGGLVTLVAGDEQEDGGHVGEVAGDEEEDREGCDCCASGPCCIERTSWPPHLYMNIPAGIAGGPLSIPLSPIANPITKWYAANDGSTPCGAGPGHGEQLDEIYIGNYTYTCALPAPYIQFAGDMCVPGVRLDRRACPALGVTYDLVFFPFDFEGCYVRGTLISCNPFLVELTLPNDCNTDPANAAMGYNVVPVAYRGKTITLTE